MSESKIERVNGKALAKATGVLWAVALVILWPHSARSWGDEWRDLLTNVYLGYDSTDRELGVGTVRAFIDGFIGAYLLVWLYELLRRPAKHRWHMRY